MLTWDALEEVAHWSGLLPLATLAVLWALNLWRAPACWWLASGFAVSWLADLAAHWADPWIVSHVYSVAQLGMVYASLTKPGRASWLLGGTGLVAAWSLYAGPLTAPAIAAWAVGALIVLALIWKRRDLGLVWWGLLIYFGLGLAFRVWFPLLMDEPEAFRLVWLGYQAARLTGLALVSAGFLRGP